MTACSDVLWYRVLWPRAILSSFMTVCLDVESAGHVLWCRVSWPQSKNDESAGHVIKCRVCWPHAKNDESVGRVLWCRVSWPRAKIVEPAGRVLTWFDLKIKNSHIKGGGWVCWPRSILSSFMTTCLDVESAGHVLWCLVSWPRAKTCSDIVCIGNVLEKKSFSYKMVFYLKTEFSSLKMNNITVIELKAIAKQHGIEGYYKLSWVDTQIGSSFRSKWASFNTGVGNVQNHN